MIYVVSQNSENDLRRIYYYHLQEDKNNNTWSIIGFDIDTKELITLGIYSNYKQAIYVFGEMRRHDNDIIYFRQIANIYYMPSYDFVLYDNSII